MSKRGGLEQVPGRFDGGQQRAWAGARCDRALDRACRAPLPPPGVPVCLAGADDGVAAPPGRPSRLRRAAAARAAAAHAACLPPLIATPQDLPDAKKSKMTTSNEGGPPAFALRQPLRRWCSRAAVAFRAAVPLRCACGALDRVALATAACRAALLLLQLPWWGSPPALASLLPRASRRRRCCHVLARSGR